MFGNEKNMSDLQTITDLLNEHAECLATIDRATKRKTEIELRLSTVKEALNRLDTQRFGVVRKPRGRPRKLVSGIVPAHFGGLDDIKEFAPEDDGNTAA